MYELCDVIARMQGHAKDLKDMIALFSPNDTSKLRSLLYIIEAAIFVMERMAADAHRAT